MESWARRTRHFLHQTWWGLVCSTALREWCRWRTGRQRGTPPSQSTRTTIFPFTWSRWYSRLTKVALLLLFRTSLLSFINPSFCYSPFTECNFVTNHDSHSRCGDACIASTVFCDERINCGSPDEFAVDEENCPGQNDSDGHIFSQHVGSFLVSIYLGAGIFFTILAAVTCYHQHKAYQRIKSIPHKWCAWSPQ